MSIKARTNTEVRGCVCVCALPMPKAGLYLTVGVVTLPLFVVQVTWKDRATEAQTDGEEDRSCF